MKNTLSFLKRNKFHIFALLIITITGLFFRFYNYPNRWGLASDQARDVLVSLVALKNHSLPLIGPFSASGPFVFGPYYYWFLEILEIFSFGSFFAVWIGQSIISFLMIYFRILIGKEVEDIKFGYLLAFFSAISGIRVGLSTNLVSSTLAGVFSSFAAYFFIRSIKHQKISDFFLLGLFTALAINTHFQAIPLIFLLILVLVLGSHGIKHILCLSLGFIIPFTPLAIFDLQSHFYESTHLIQYFIFAGHGSQTRWLTYLQNWPNVWGVIVGNDYRVTTAAIFCILAVSAYRIYKKKVSKPMLGIGIFVFLTFVSFRYFSGILFLNFISFLVPFVLILTVWCLRKLIKINLIIGIALTLCLGLSTMQGSFEDITNATNYTSLNSKLLEKLIVQEFPKNAKFQVYDYEYKSSSISLPLLLYLNEDNKLSSSGIKIGVGEQTLPNVKVLNETKQYYHTYIFSLNNSTDRFLRDVGWDPVSPQSVYNETENWYKKPSE